MKDISLSVKRLVEETYSRHPWLRPARHVIVVLDEIVHREADKVIRFSGLQPGWRKDVIIISYPLLRQDTIVHETLHTYGCGENCTWTIAPRLARLRTVFPPLIKRSVSYRICSGGCEFDLLHKKYPGKIIHLVLED